MLAICVLLLASSPARRAQPASTPTPQQQQFNLAAFSNITSCLPFNVLITASPAGSPNAYQLSSQVAPEVSAALRVAVNDGTLFLGFNRSFESTQPIRVTASLPADKLKAVTNQGMGSIIINPGGYGCWDS